jgi:hypothetical protein
MILREPFCAHPVALLKGRRITVGAVYHRVVAAIAALAFI